MKTDSLFFRSHLSPTRHTCVIRLALLTFLGSASLAPIQAVSFTIQASSRTGSYAGGYQEAGQHLNEPGTAQGSLDQQSTALTAIATSRATAQPGILRAFASVNAAASQQLDQVYTSANALATFADALTIDAPGLAGQVGTATASLWVTGSLSGDSQSIPGSQDYFQSGSGMSVQIGSSPWSEHYANLNQDPLSSTFPADGRLNITFSFIFGTPFPLHAQLSTVANAGGFSDAGGSFTAFAISDFENSLYWNGISNLQVDGTPLSVNYNLTSSDGIDYGRSYAPSNVPDTGSSAMLFGMALTALAIARRRS